MSCARSALRTSRQYSAPAKVQASHDRSPGRTLDHGIWAYAFGYFACYAPYSALTKAMTDGRLPGMKRPVGGFELLPITTVASLAAMLVFITYMGWWKYARSTSVLGLRVPRPSRWTFLSGVSTAGIIATTTLAYTFNGVSIVFMMLLMRGGMLVLAPVVDVLSKRRVRWYSGVALALSLAALLVATVGPARIELTAIATVDVIVYLAAYLVRLRFMSRLAKSNERERSIAYFVEEQMVATPVIVLALVAVAVVGHGSHMLEVRRGFLELWDSGGVIAAVVIGLLSQGTGVFGGLILLDGRENSFCVPVNRASSILAGVLASLTLGWLVGAPPLSGSEYAGAGLIVLAIAALAWPMISRPRPGEARSP